MASRFFLGALFLALIAPHAVFAAMDRFDGMREERDRTDRFERQGDRFEKEGKEEPGDEEFFSDDSFKRFSKELRARACGKGVGAPIIDVTHAVIGDVDRGTAGVWAFNLYTRHIRVWQTAPTHFCSIVTFIGTSTGIPGSVGPAGTGTVGGGVVARSYGGYRIELDATFIPTIQWPLMGFVGKSDYGCDATGTTCTPVVWPLKYFSPLGQPVLSWWGFVYQAGKHGTWVNTIAGSKGNIL